MYKDAVSTREIEGLGVKNVIKLEEIIGKYITSR